MSIVGTRPPTLDEWNKYELHHRARLAIKPGMSNAVTAALLPRILILSHREPGSTMRSSTVGV